MAATTYYSDSDGSNDAPYETWAKAATSIQTVADLAVAGDSVYARGTQTLAASVDIDTTTGSLVSGYITFVGCNAAGVEDGTRFVLDGDSAATNCLNGGGAAFDYYYFRNFECKNATSDGIDFSADDNCIFYNCYTHTNGRYGLNLATNGVYNKVIRCIANNNTNIGFIYGASTAYVNCVAIGNGSTGFNGWQYTKFYGCIASNNTTSQFAAASISASWYNCVADGWTGSAAAGIGINMNSVGNDVYGCRITSNATGIKLIVADFAFYDYCGLYGNTADTSVPSGNLLADGGNNVSMSASGYVAASGNFNLLETAEARRTEIDLDGTNSFYITAGLNGPDYMRPRVVGLSRVKGNIGGGYPIDISGGGFVTGTTFTLGGNAISATIDSDVFASGLVPAHASGLVDLAVLASGITWTSSSAYEYTDEMATLTVTPSVASTDGYQTVVITNTEGAFVGVTSVTFEGEEAISFVVNTTNQITAVIPHIGGGFHRIEVS